MNNEHFDFLRLVRSYITKHPELAPRVTEFVTQVVEDARALDLQRAADFESVTVMLLNKRYGKREHDYVLEKLIKWNGNAAMNWTDHIARMK